MVAYDTTFAVETASDKALFAHVVFVGRSPSYVGGLMSYCDSRSKYELHTRAFVMASIWAIVGPR